MNANDQNLLSLTFEFVDEGKINGNEYDAKILGDTHISRSLYALSESIYLAVPFHFRAANRGQEHDIFVRYFIFSSFHFIRNTVCLFFMIYSNDIWPLSEHLYETNS